MKAIVDDKIPYIAEAIEAIAEEVIYVPGTQFTPALVRDADVLIVRTRTHCDENLLAGSKVKYIATATIGYDHLDTDYLQKANIAWGNAPGCNARSVAQYLLSTFLCLAQEKNLQLSQTTLGIVGVGHVGKEIQKVALKLGMKVLCNDPIRAEIEGNAHFVSLKTVQDCCDIITFHTPLTSTGKYPTHHLADTAFFAGLKQQPYLINTSRGEVVATTALNKALAEQQIKGAVIDVWENEPNIDKTLLKKAYIATPHIAGYSADGKANASRQSIANICHYFGCTSQVSIHPPQPLLPSIVAPSLEEAMLQIYNPHSDSKALKAHPEQFESLRGHYPLRREKEAYKIKIIESF